METINQLVSAIRTAQRKLLDEFPVGTAIIVGGRMEDGSGEVQMDAEIIAHYIDPADGIKVRIANPPPGRICLGVGTKKTGDRVYEVNIEWTDVVMKKLGN